MKIISAALLFLLCTLSLPSFSEGVLEIHQPWTRASAPGAPAAGFLTVLNRTDSADILLDVSGRFAQRVELHRSSMVDGMMKMIHQRDGVTIPAGGDLLLEPGSYHLMFMGLAQPFVVGETYSVQLSFQQAGVIEVILPVLSTEPSTDR